MVLTAPAAAAAEDVLPDLDQRAPSDISLRKVGSRWRLGFASAVANVGDAPLILRAHRANRRTPTMTADQLVEQDEGSPRLVTGVGQLRFVVASDHRHWHLAGFERYEVRRAGVVRRDRKSGFCLGDRYQVRGYETEARLTGRCGLSQPNLLDLFQGISVGWGDDYDAHVEGQFVDVTGLRPGRYTLVHRIGAPRLVERRPGNNAASALIDLSPPRVRVLRTCPATATCR